MGRHKRIKSGEERMRSIGGQERYVPLEKQKAFIARGWKYVNEPMPLSYYERLKDRQRKLREVALDEVSDILDEGVPGGVEMTIYSCKYCERKNPFRSFDGGEVAAHLYKYHESEMKKAVENWMKENLIGETGRFIVEDAR